MNTSYQTVQLNTTAFTVSAETTRSLNQWEALATRLTEIGFPLSKSSTEQLDTIRAGQRQVREAHAQVQALADSRDAAALAGDVETLRTIAPAAAAAEYVWTALNATTNQRMTNAARLIESDYRGQRASIVAKFNAAGAKATSLWHETINARPLTAQTVATDDTAHTAYSELVTLADTLASTSAAIDLLDARQVDAHTLADMANDPYRWGRNLAHPSHDQRPAWLADQLHIKTARWLAILTMTARPDTHTELRFDVEQAEQDREAQRNLAIRWNQAYQEKRDGMTFEDFAALWWEQNPDGDGDVEVAGRTWTANEYAAHVREKAAKREKAKRAKARAMQGMRI